MAPGEQASSPYGTMHKLVLKGFTTAGLLDVRGLKELFRRTCQKLSMSEEETAVCTSKVYIEKIVREIRTKLTTDDAGIGMAIRTAVCELTGKKHLLFVIPVTIPFLRLEILYCEFEVKLFKRILNDALTKYQHFSISLKDCSKIASEIDSRDFCKVLAASFINEMIKLQYFTKFFPNPEERYQVTIGIRTIKEFEIFLGQNYGEAMGNCYLCKMMMLHGQQCRNCNKNFHKVCLEKYLRTCPTCPECKCDLKGENGVLVRRANPSWENSDTTEEREEQEEERREQEDEGEEQNDEGEEQKDEGEEQKDEGEEQKDEGEEQKDEGEEQKEQEDEGEEDKEQEDEGEEDKEQEDEGEEEGEEDEEQEDEGEEDEEQEEEGEEDEEQEDEGEEDEEQEEEGEEDEEQEDEGEEDEEQEEEGEEDEEQEDEGEEEEEQVEEEEEQGEEEDVEESEEEVEASSQKRQVPQSPTTVSGTEYRIPAELGPPELTIVKTLSSKEGESGRKSLQPTNVASGISNQDIPVLESMVISTQQNHKEEVNKAEEVKNTLG